MPSVGVVGTLHVDRDAASDRDFGVTGERRLAHGGRAVIDAARPAETVFPPVGRFSVKVFRAVMSTANEAMMAVLEAIVVLADDVIVVVRLGAAGPPTAAFTELTSGV